MFCSFVLKNRWIFRPKISKVIQPEPDTQQKNVSPCMVIDKGINDCEEDLIMGRLK